VHLSIELDREDDGRWIAEALELPGVMTYGQTREEAIGNTERLAIEVIADRIKHAELRRRPSTFVSGAERATGRRLRRAAWLAALERIGWRVKRQSGFPQALSS